jgi:hypothetical protein
MIIFKRNQLICAGVLDDEYSGGGSSNVYDSSIQNRPEVESVHDELSSYFGIKENLLASGALSGGTVEDKTIVGQATDMFSQLLPSFLGGTTAAPSEETYDSRDDYLTNQFGETYTDLSPNEQAVLALNSAKVDDAIMGAVGGSAATSFLTPGVGTAISGLFSLGDFLFGAEDMMESSKSEVGLTEEEAANVDAAYLTMRNSLLPEDGYGGSHDEDNKEKSSDSLGLLAGLSETASTTDTPEVSNATAETSGLGMLNVPTLDVDEDVLKSKGA